VTAEEKIWLIWSAEHQGFWRPHGAGYTMNPLKAGRYTETEAKKICDEANRYVTEPQEFMIRIEGY
jgi:hypothetical protein